MVRTDAAKTALALKPTTCSLRIAFVSFVFCGRGAGTALGHQKLPPCPLTHSANRNVLKMKKDVLSIASCSPLGRAAPGRVDDVQLGRGFVRHKVSPTAPLHRDH